MTTWTIQRDGNTLSQLVLDDAAAAKAAAYAIHVRANCIEQTPATAAAPAVLDGDGQIITPAVVAAPAVMRDPTADEAIGLQAEDFFGGFLARATEWYRAKAAADAAAAVSPITAS